MIHTLFASQSSIISPLARIARQGMCVGLMATALWAAPQSAQAAEVASLHEHAVTGPLQWIDGAYESPKSKAECVALQAKLMTKKTALQASEPWRSMANSAAYKTFSEARDSLKAAECHKAAEGAQKDACVSLTQKLNQEADGLAQTSEWKKLTASTSWKNLFNDFNRARKLGCVKPTHVPQGMK